MLVEPPARTPCPSNVLRRLKAHACLTAAEIIWRRTHGKILCRPPPTSFDINAVKDNCERGNDKDKGCLHPRFMLKERWKTSSASVFGTPWLALNAREGARRPRVRSARARAISIFQTAYLHGDRIWRRHASCEDSYEHSEQSLSVSDLCSPRLSSSQALSLDTGEEQLTRWTTTKFS